MLRIQTGNYCYRTTGLPGASVDFEIHLWIDCNDTTAVQSYIYIVGAFDTYVYIDTGNLHIYTGSTGDTDFGAVPTVPFHIVIYRSGATITFKIRTTASSTYSTIKTDTEFGTGAITHLEIGADNASGYYVLDSNIGRLRMWSSVLADDTARYLESHSRMAKVTSNLLFDCIWDLASDWGLSKSGSLGDFTTIIGTPSLIDPKFVVVSDSVGNGYNPLGGVWDDGWARENGLATSTEMIARNFSVTPGIASSSKSSLAIDGWEMDQHAADIASSGGLREQIDDSAGGLPHWIVILFGGINDIALGSFTASQTLTKFQTLADEVQRFGMSVIACGPTDVSPDSSGLSDLRSLLISNSDSFDDVWDPGAPPTNYTIGADGIHVTNYTVFTPWANSKLDLFLSGTFTSVISTETEGFRFRNDNGSETTASWLDFQDTNINILKSTNFRLRILTNFSGDISSNQRSLYYRLVGDSDSEWEIVGAE